MSGLYLLTFSCGSVYYGLSKNSISLDLVQIKIMTITLNTCSIYTSLVTVIEYSTLNVYINGDLFPFEFVQCIDKPDLKLMIKLNINHNLHLNVISK